MARRRQPDGEKPVPTAAAPLNAPFADLRRRLRATAPPAPPVVKRPPPPPAPPPPDDRRLFADAMAGVAPLARGGRVASPGPASEPRPPVSEEMEALAALSDLVEGAAHFDVTDTREYVEGQVVGLDPRLVRRLRRGDFSWQAHLDLHGLIADEARIAVDRFLAESVVAGHRCVLIVHGRGLNSKDQTPVLKEKMKGWLARGRAAHVVLAFTTARPVDGGAGALYVLLRRTRDRRPIRVTEGAKR